MKRSLITLSVVASLAAPVLLLLTSCERRAPKHPKVIVIGFDGLDPILCERLMDAGQMPVLDQMRRAGGYRRLGTSIPPQSPVAWASFITGANPGVHGIFDFFHRDPKRQCFPYYSAAETIDGEGGWKIGKHKLPLTFWPFGDKAPETKLRRGGKPFWDYLDEAGIPVWLYDIPANYPPSESEHGHIHCLSGMGVPDLRGGFGTYQFFSEDSFLPPSEEGGLRQPLFFERNSAEAKIVGPENSYLKSLRRAEIPFVVYKHPSEASARIEIQGQTILLKEGEWSGWTKLDFSMEMPSFLPNSHVSGICRFFLQEVRPNFRLYVTPINIDPSDPGGQRITEPPDFITEMADELGLFYTAGFQEDHKALSNKIFSDEEFKRQADYVLKERLSLRDFAVDHYEDGFLFFYFSSTDLQAHMFWWDSDEKHPIRSAEEARKYHNVIIELYRQIDGVVGEVVDRFGDDATIFVMSDHGFSNFRRQFNLNTWLRSEGYVKPDNCKSLISRRPLADWSRTTAYGLGLNGLYVNLKGREKLGIVSPGERDALLDEITEKLLAYRDPQDGQPVIAKVYRSEEVYTGPLAANAPDLIIGYHRGYRAAWATVLGDITPEIIEDNRAAWSADHCIAAELIPGVIFSNKRITRNQPSLVDLAPTILEAFNLSPPKTMEGKSLFSPSVVADADYDVE